MISKINNNNFRIQSEPVSEQKPLASSQTNSTKNEVSIESIEFAEIEKNNSDSKGSSLIIERKLQAEVRASELQRKLDQIGTEKSLMLPYIEQDNS
ncbi:hypothetical protein L0156_00910 [bacterium]|nr:hypothetical protein [bacterium]